MAKLEYRFLMGEKNNTEDTMVARRQVAALPLRQAKDGALEILLVTSRDTGRWIIPKGWTSKRIKDCKAAAREAREEAGVKGKILRDAIGTYRYIKREVGHGALIEVRVFLLKVSKRCKRWPEKRERRRAWFDLKVAASKVSDPELSTLIGTLQEGNGGGGTSGQT
ncbi:MAG TPA: NUDIX hydrolase [Geobacterales bacterium]|nr:NUDIX hydrolase [Geobacterales bacterium]